MTDYLIFQENDMEINIGGVKFINVPTILQYEETKLIEVAHILDASFSLKFKIFNKDGIEIASVHGTDIYLTEDGKKSKVQKRNVGDVSICEVDGRTIYEVRRESPRSLKAVAELYTPNGAFIKCKDTGIFKSIIGLKDEGLKIGNLTMYGSTIIGAKIGILIKEDGSTQPGDSNELIVPKKSFKYEGKIPNPNDKCPCGSGKKFKKCHGIPGQTKIQ